VAITVSALLIVAVAAPLSAQPAKLELSGTVTDSDNIALQDVHILIKGTPVNGYTDAKGTFALILAAGKYEVVVSKIGYEKYSYRVTLPQSHNKSAQIRLQPSKETALGEALVVGHTSTQEAARQAYQVTVVDAKQLHNKSVNIAHALSTVPGIRVRESGGVGSDIDFSLNGFTGNQVKFFIDGIPMDNMGSSFRINNIPINIADRIEVYKGVVPVTLGSDALGGAINIVTNSGSTNYLDASYSYGSFNTHKTSVNLGLTTKKGYVVQLNAYQNYSANNYWIQSETPIDQYLTNKMVRARRFHDQYSNEMLMVGIGVVKRKWADRLMLGLDLGKNNKEIQSGATMEDVYGQRRSRGNILMPSLKYLKRNIGIAGLDLNISANYNLGAERIIDTANRQYNWLGQVVKEGAPSQLGGERSRQDYRYRNNNGTGIINLSYRLNEQHSFVVNDNYMIFNRKGKDLLEEMDERINQPSRLDKNVLGITYRFDYSPRWNTSIFFKHYSQYSKAFAVVTDNIESPTFSDYGWREEIFKTSGYGFATTYFISKDLQLRTSYEHGVRVPTTNELFGNMNDLTGNISLKPESSENVNLGLIYNTQWDKTHFVTVDAGFLYRYSKDFIRPNLAKGSKFTTQQMVNLRDVDNKGIEGSIRYRYKNVLNIGMNLSYQNLINQTKYEDGDESTISLVYQDRIPNMPYLFGNFDAAYSINSIIEKGDNLTVGYQLYYVHDYYVGWPSLGTKSTKQNIPTQWNHCANIMYNMKGGRYNITLEGLNLSDALLYDHYKLQKPSRSFNVKLRYFLFGIK